MVIARLSRSLSISLALVLALALLAGIAPLSVRAASHAVTVTLNDASPGLVGGNSDIIHSPGCATTGLPGVPGCSLRDAVLYANAQAATDTTTITLPVGTYTLTISGSDDRAMTGDLDLRRNVAIVGAGAGMTIVQASLTNSASGIDRIFDVGAFGDATSATFSGVTIRHGNSPGGIDGGGILVETSGSSLTLNDCVVADNQSSRHGGGLSIASGATLILNRTAVSGNITTSTRTVDGGGIFNAGTVTVTNSTFFGNHADSDGGGGIYNSGGILTVTNSTFAASSATAGGGIYSSGGTLTVTNSTFAANHADSGGGIWIYGSTPTVTNSTFAGNTARYGGGIDDESGTLTAINTLIAGNTVSGGNGPDAVASFSAGSKNNLLGIIDNNTIGITNGVNGNLVGTTASPINPLLDTTLRDNGTTNGTQTLALLPGSPAINAGDIATCTNTNGTAPVAGKDQRGITRPQGTACDIGAFEYVGAAMTATTTTLASSVNPSTAGQSVTFTATVMGTGGTPTGTVTFKDGAATLGTGTLAGGVATFTTTTLVAGSHAITAVYSGDASFAPSTSAILTQVVNPGGGGTTGGLQFFPLSAPVRLLDTRPGQAAVVHPGVPLTPNQALTLPGQFSSGGITVPAGAQALVGNATVDNTVGAPAGFATLYPSGSALPLASNLNFVPGTVRPNAFTVGLGSDGKFNLLSNTGGNFIIDVSGYYAPPAAGGLFFHPLAAPVRLLDTRAGQTAFKSPGVALTPGQTLSLPGQFTSSGVTIPTSAKALAGNATVDNTANAPAGFATLFPGGTTLPPTSNLNFAPGTVAPNAFTVGLGGDGSFNLYANTGGNFILDVTGYYDMVGAGGLLFFPLSQPVRELDTRAGQQAFKATGTPLTATGTLNLPGSFTFSGVTVPNTAKALVGNATVDNSINAPDGFATLFPGGTSLPLASNLNYSAGTVAPNAFIVGSGIDGTYNLYSLSGGNFIIDISGYFAAPQATARLQG